MNYNVYRYWLFSVDQTQSHPIGRDYLPRGLCLIECMSF